MTQLFSRRGLIGAIGATLALPKALLAQTATFDVDVAIVGAGSAGIAAARELQKLRKTFLILEARDRLGGRTFTDTSLGAPFDAGALYIHWAERNPWRDIARELKIPVVDSSSISGGSQFFDNGSQSDRGGGRRGFQSVMRLFDTDEGAVPDVSFVERVAHIGEGAASVAAIARMAIGEEPEKVSALDYARLWSGDDLVVPSGYGTLVTRYGQGLDVRLSTPVTGIDTSGAGVVLETPSGRIRARTAIVTIPVGVLKAGGVRFTPDLPVATQEGINGLGMGALSKIGLRFNGNRFGLRSPTDVWERLGPRASINFDCWSFNRDIVVAYFGGDHAREVVGRGSKEAIGYVLDEFVKIIGPEARKAYVDGVMHGWSVDPWSMGCYSHALPGHADARAKLKQPVAERLFFAGEATGGDGFGGAMTAGGAALAGREAAQAAAKA
jgi:monoamine oxidase